jgi:hypothetical protein
MITDGSGATGFDNFQASSDDIQLRSTCSPGQIECLWTISHGVIYTAHSTPAAIGGRPPLSYAADYHRVLVWCSRRLTANARDVMWLDLQVDIRLWLDAPRCQLELRRESERCSGWGFLESDLCVASSDKHSRRAIRGANEALTEHQRGIAKARSSSFSGSALPLVALTFLTGHASAASTVHHGALCATRTSTDAANLLGGAAGEPAHRQRRRQKA